MTDIQTVAQLLKNRAYIFLCSYKTAWNQFMSLSERCCFTYEQIEDYLKGLKNDESM